MESSGEAPPILADDPYPRPKDNYIQRIKGVASVFPLLLLITIFDITVLSLHGSFIFPFSLEIADLLPFAFRQRLFLGSVLVVTVGISQLAFFTVLWRFAVRANLWAFIVALALIAIDFVPIFMSTPIRPFSLFGHAVFVSCMFQGISLCRARNRFLSAPSQAQ